MSNITTISYKDIKHDLYNAVPYTYSLYQEKRKNTEEIIWKNTEIIIKKQIDYLIDLFERGANFD